MYTSSLADRAGILDDNPHMLSIPLALAICYRSAQHTQTRGSGKYTREETQHVDQIKGGSYSSTNKQEHSSSFLRKDPHLPSEKRVYFIVS